MLHKFYRVLATTKKKCLSLHSKQSIRSLCLSNPLKDLLVDSWKKTGLYGSVFNFSIDYYSANVEI